MARLILVVIAIAPFVAQAFVHHAALPRVRALPSAVHMISDEVGVLRHVESRGFVSCHSIESKLCV